MLKKIFSLFFVALTVSSSATNNQLRWKLDNQSNNGISWIIKDSKLPHNDDIEMAGLQAATIIRYGVNEQGTFYLNRGMIWPMLRTIPNNTHASLMRRFGDDIPSKILINGRSLENEKVSKITLNGIMTVISSFEGEIQLKRELFPSTTLPTFCEKYTLTNLSDKPKRVEIPNATSTIQTPEKEGVAGSYKLVTILKGNTAIIKPNENITFSYTISGYKPTEKIAEIDINTELQKRIDFINEISSNLVLETPDETLNTLFRFAKIRTSESIFKTKGGLLHGPGGESYYAAIWANDQAEYVNPFFPFLGYNIANESALVAYKMFARYMNNEFNPIPSSIIAEGDDFWAGAGDRGDAAMIAYGASRYALEMGNKKVGEELWPLITWSLEFCKRKLLPQGVVASDADELEGRFPSGVANLCTSSLYYDALQSAYYLGKELGKPEKEWKIFMEQSKKMRVSIEKYFGSKVEGFDTYRYYDGNDRLRAWICIPLTMGITERKENTINALLSDKLWTENGMLTQSGDKTFWDRTTLYALRGMLYVGETERAIPFLQFYSNTRLMGERVPYPIEAWPEGGKRHLAAESGLYCRIFTEGLFGIRPTGLKSFTLTPHLPKEWNDMKMRNIRAFGGNIDISVKRLKDKLQIKIETEGKLLLNKQITPNTTISVKIG